MTLFEALTTNPLLLAAVAACLAAAIASGIIGSYVVVKRIVFIAGSISHAVLGGIGLCIWLERSHGITTIPPLLGAIITAVISALIIGWMRLRYREREDSAIAALWSIGMAAGVIFMSQTPGFTGELANYLLGNILWVSKEDLLALLALDLVILVTVACLHQRFLAICFDEEQAKLQGVRVNALYLLLLSLIAITVVLLIEVVGIILVLTMLALPAALANLFLRRLSSMMALAVAFSACFSLAGMEIAYQLDWPSGATIALLIGSCYLTATVVANRRHA